MQRETLPGGVWKRLEGRLRLGDPNPISVLYRGVVVTTIVVALLVLAVFWFNARKQEEDEWVRHTLAVRSQIAAVVDLVQRAEASQRGYLLTGRTIYLEPFEAVVSALPQALDRLTVLVADNRREQQFVGGLCQLAQEKIGELRSTIAQRAAGNLEASLAVVNSDYGLRLMDDLRQTGQSIGDEENRTLAARQSRAALFGILLQAGAGLALVLICAVGVLISVLSRRSYTEIATAHAALLVANRELTEQIARRERAEGQLRQLQKMEAIGQLTGGVAHDFNNMLGAIGGSLELMERRLAKGDFGIERYLQTARQAVLRAATLTHRLLAFARKQPLAPTVFNPNQLITEMSDLLRSTLDETIAIETVLGAGLWLVEADSNQLESTILNIAINARDAMAEGGKLMIETSNAALDQAYCDQNDEVEPGQYIMVAISDTGSGMSADIAQRAFDPFFTTKPAGTGTGLGLSQVYGFIKQSRGHVKIYSELDAGTTVRIYLPRSLSQPGVTTTTIAQPQLAGLAGEVVLVVEDDDAMRHHTAEALRELGYSVLESASAAQALELLAGAPDVTVLLTDVVMPSMDGKRLADEARRRRPELKVLFMTGYTPNAVVHGGILDPAVQFLSKPFTLEELARKLRLVMAKAG